jgi:acetolactate decarboxylase
MTHSSACTCQQSLCETIRGFSAQHPDSVLYQTSLMSALLSGVYEGNTTIADLLTHGDFGLGTFNELDGELIAFSSEVYQLRADGSARKARRSKNAVRGDDLVSAAVPRQLRPSG